MFCTQCGNKTNKTDKFCNKCGANLSASENLHEETAVENLDEELEDQNFEDEKVEEKPEPPKQTPPSKPGVFPLFGHMVEIPQSLQNYNIFYKKFEKLAMKVEQDFIAEYKKNIHNLDDVINKSQAIYVNFLETAIKVAVEDLVSNGVYDIDAENFLNLHKEKLSFPDTYHIVEEAYSEIIEDAAAKDAYRTHRRQNRDKWVGYGFGISGAMKASAKAGAMNMASGMAHGTFNLIGSAFTAIGASMEKDKIFNDPQLLENLAFATSNDCLRVATTLVELLKKKGFNIVTGTDSKKATTMFNTMSSKSFPKKDIIPTAIQIILLHPYSEKIYTFLIEKFHDEKMEVENLANYFGFGEDVSEYKISLLGKFYQDLPKATYEEIIASKEELAKHGKTLGGVPNEMLTKIDELLEERKIEKIQKMFQDLPKKTLKELYACKEKIEICCNEIKPKNQGNGIFEQIDELIHAEKNRLAMEFIKSQPSKTEEEMLIAKEKLLAYCDKIKLSRKNPAVEKVDKMLVDYDIAIRTVDDILFQTRELANEAKTEKVDIEHIIEKYKLIYRWEYVELINELSAHAHNQELNAPYISHYSNQLAAFDKKAKRASRYNYRKSKKIRILHSGNIKTAIAHWSILIITVALWFNQSGIPPLLGFVIYLVASRYYERKAWNELTDYGRDNFDEIIGENIVVVADTPQEFEEQEIEEFIDSEKTP
ncbi:MAG: zinc ribbon domain-containing protein [Firmicutes bacterium]|nr:zinc ribbon domain-containing protein [Bacillota bacterium]